MRDRPTEHPTERTRVADEIMAGDVTVRRPSGARQVSGPCHGEPTLIEAGAGTAPPSSSKAIATSEGNGDLGQWVRAALGLVKSGAASVLCTAPRWVGQPVGGGSPAAGEIVIFPLWPMAGKPAKRVVVRARKEIRTPLRLAARTGAA